MGGGVWAQFQPRSKKGWNPWESTQSAYIEYMNTEPSHISERLEIKPGPSVINFSLGVSIITLIAIPFILWLGLGPGAAGDTSVNGNSVLAFWGMRVFLAAGFLWCLFKIPMLWKMRRDMPVLYTLDKIGITNRQNITTPWSEVERIYFVSKSGDLVISTRARSGFKDIRISENVVGWDSVQLTMNFMKKHLAADLTHEL